MSSRCTAGPAVQDDVYHRPAVRGRTRSSRVSMARFGLNASTAGFSPTVMRRKSSLSSGDRSTISGVRTAALAISLRLFLLNKFGSHSLRTSPAGRSARRTEASRHAVPRISSRTRLRPTPPHELDRSRGARPESSTLTTNAAISTMPRMKSFRNTSILAMLSKPLRSVP